MTGDDAQLQRLRFLARVVQRESKHLLTTDRRVFIAVTDVAKRTRILHITRNLPPLVGGMERLNWHIADELSRYARVQVIGLRGAAAFKPANVELHEVPLRPLPGFLLIIFKIASLYSPLKLFAPTAAAFFLAALGWYGYTFASQGRLTNMSTLLFSVAVIVFLIGLVSEKITNLTYRRDG